MEAWTTREFKPSIGDPFGQFSDEEKAKNLLADVKKFCEDLLPSRQIGEYLLCVIQESSPEMAYLTDEVLPIMCNLWDAERKQLRALVEDYRKN